MGLYCLGYVKEAAALGFQVYETRDKHPKYVLISIHQECATNMLHSHRHVRYGLFFHSLAMVACIRQAVVGATEKDRYLKQVKINQEFIKKYTVIYWSLVRIAN